MKKVFFLALFVAIASMSTMGQTSKTGIAYLLPIENKVLKPDSASIPFYQRFKILWVNPVTLAPENPDHPEPVVVYVKVKDAAGLYQMEEIMEAVKEEPVVLDGSLIKERKLKKIRRKGDVEVTEAFVLDNWAKLSLAKERISQVIDQPVLTAEKAAKIDSAFAEAYQTIDSVNQAVSVLQKELKKVKEENAQLKKQQTPSKPANTQPIAKQPASKPKNTTPRVVVADF